MIEYSRSNGDVLSLVFNNDATLSTAQLVVLGESWDVSSYLPGLSEANVECYVRTLGFTGRDDRVGSVQSQLEPLGLSLDCGLEIFDDSVLAFVIRNQDRIIPCPCVIAVCRFHIPDVRLVKLVPVDFAASKPLSFLTSL